MKISILAKTSNFSWKSYIKNPNYNLKSVTFDTFFEKSISLIRNLDFLRATLQHFLIIKPIRKLFTISSFSDKCTIIYISFRKKDQNRITFFHFTSLHSTFTMSGYRVPAKKLKGISTERAGLANG